MRPASSPTIITGFSGQPLQSPYRICRFLQSRLLGNTLFTRDVVVALGVWVVNESGVHVLVVASCALLQPDHLNPLFVFHRRLQRW